MKKVRKRLVGPAVAVATTSALVACGGGGDSGGSGGGAVEGRTLKIGVSAPLSGPLATAGTATKCGAQAFLSARNDDGGVNGYQFEVTPQDNQYDPGVAASVARDFATDGAFAVVIAGTSTMEASVPVLEPRGIPVFGSPDGAILTPPDWEGLFGYNPIYANEGASAAVFIQETLEQSEASAVYLAPAAQPAADSFAAAFEEAGGTVAVNEALPPDVTDFAAMAQRLKSAGAPVVYTTLVDTQLAGLQKAADAIGYNPTWVSWTIAQGPTYLELAGDLAEGVYFSQWTTPETETDDPEVQAYLDAMANVEGCEELAGDTAGKTGYALGAAIAYGVEQATADDGELTSEAFTGALSDVEDHQFGLTPHMSYDDESHAGVRQNSYWVYESGQLQMARDFEPLPEA